MIAIDSKTGVPSGPFNAIILAVTKVDRKMSIFRVQGCAGVKRLWTRKIDILRTTCKHTVMVAPVEERRDA